MVEGSERLEVEVGLDEAETTHRVAGFMALTTRMLTTPYSDVPGTSRGRNCFQVSLNLVNGARFSSHSTIA